MGSQCFVCYLTKPWFPGIYLSGTLKQPGYFRKSTYGGINCSAGLPCMIHTYNGKVKIFHWDVLQIWRNMLGMCIVTIFMLCFYSRPIVSVGYMRSYGGQPQPLVT